MKETAPINIKLTTFKEKAYKTLFWTLKSRIRMFFLVNNSSHSTLNLLGMKGLPFQMKSNRLTRMRVVFPSLPKSDKVVAKKPLYLKTKSFKCTWGLIRRSRAKIWILIKICAGKLTSQIWQIWRQILIIRPTSPSSSSSIFIKIQILQLNTLKCIEIKTSPPPRTRSHLIDSRLIVLEELLLLILPHPPLPNKTWCLVTYSDHKQLAWATIAMNRVRWSSTTTTIMAARIMRTVDSQQI